MRKQVFCLGVFFASTALLACSHSPVVGPLTTSITPTNSTTIYPGSTSEVTVSPAVFTTPLVSYTPIKPEIQIVSPNRREVKLAELGLNDSTSLLLYYQPSNSLRIISGKDVTPQKIPNIDPGANFTRINLRHISPDHKWFTYYTFKEVKDDLVYHDYWISSINGKNQWIIAPGVSSGMYAEWVTNEQIELWHYQSRYNCPKRIAILNPFSRETVVPPEAPSSPIPQCVFPLSTNPDGTKTIYYEEGTWTWNIFDFNTGAKQRVFPWLSQSEASKLWPRYIRWLPSGITLALPNHDSVDFAIDLQPSSASDINGQWNKLLLPSSNTILNNSFPWWSLDDGLIGFDMVESDVDLIIDRRESPPSKFIILDLRHSILYDYNLDRAKTGDRQKVSDYFISASADNRFLAWTIYEPPDMSYASETVVLERATGRIARIKGFEFFGWGEVEPP
ncbi:MAG: hypothetical protein JW730_19120 [Anaerolineales bacterium]|nr:hypothetical protein [Anaerolineales bacterium]